MKRSCIPLSLSLAVGFSSLATPMFADETLEVIEMDLNEAPGVLYLAQNMETPDAEEEMMPAVRVTGKQESSEDGYQGRQTRVGKTDQLTKDLPQSVTIISQELMNDRNAYTLKDALRNAAGLTFNAGEGGGASTGDNINIRGYSAFGDIYLDGVRDVARYNRETFNLEQTEVLRGSVSMLYGRGSTGGVINQVSKTPEQTDHYKLDLSGGSYRFMRATTDFNKRLSDTVAVRLNSMVTSADSFRVGAQQRRWGIAPSLSWQITPKDEFTLSYYLMRENNVPDFGLPFYRGKPLNVPINRFYGMSNFDYEKNHASIVTARLIHKFSENATLRSTLRQANYGFDMHASAPRLDFNTVNASTALRRGRQARGSVNNALISQTEFNGKFKTGPFKHELLNGFEFAWERSERWMNQSRLGNPQTTVGNPDRTPVLPVGFGDSFSREDRNSYNSRTASFYAQDTIEVLPHLKVMMGTRFDGMRANFRRPTLGDMSRNDNVWSYRGGLIYQPNDISSYYAAYGTSFNPSAELYQLDQRSVTNVNFLDSRIQNTPPEKSQNLEAGSKWELLNGNLSLRTAVFRTQKTNERYLDLTRMDSAILTGKRHTDGIEVETVGNLTKRWKILGSMALMRSEISDAGGTLAATRGNRPLNTPNYTYNVWSTYTFNFHGKWKIGGGLEGMGMRFANAENTLKVPGYSRVDGMVEYTARDRYVVRLNIFNLLNQKYFDGVYPMHVVPAIPRIFNVTVALKV